MPLAPGTRLGPYEILSLMGVGGMGEVYRATDTKLKRQVAIKVLPASVSGDADRLARLQREAEVLASLNHPHIAAIYGIEDTTDAKALVMELVEGPTLAERLTSSFGLQASGRAIPIEEALAIARQIAEALEAAHEQGIVHRDLKPANVKVRDDGTVKVLDFGLAKALQSGAGTRDPGTAENSPTISMHATEAGMILGTAAYMSPEQAKGRSVDKRSDLWAFGCVLFEMLTGRRAFQGEDVADTLANVLKTDPLWDALPADTPPGVTALVRGCLQRDPQERITDIAVARFLFGNLTLGTSGPAFVPKPGSRRRMALVVTSLFAVALAVAIATGLMARSFPTSRPRPVTRFRIALAPGARLINSTGNAGGQSIALSEDGSQLVYAAFPTPSSSEWQFFLQASDQLEAVPVRGARIAAGSTPFFSPDGKWIGFAAEGKLQKVPSGGGAAIALCDARNAAYGATWMADDTIVFAPQGDAGLSRVAASGGTPKILTKPDGVSGLSHRWPEGLPGGKAVLFTIQRPNTDFNGAAIAVLRLDTGLWTVVVEGGTAPHYLPSGHLVFVRNGAMFGVPFDPVSLRVTGTAVTLIDDVFESTATGAAKLAVSGTGSVAYVPGGPQQLARAMVWVDRRGAVQPLPAPHHPFESPRLAPDGRHVAVGINNGATAGDRDIWLYDVTRTTLSRLTSEKEEAETPRWSPDGKLVTYAALRSRVRQFVRIPADGSGAGEVLAGNDRHLHLGSWSPRGDGLISGAVQGVDAGSLWVLAKGDTWTLRPYLKNSFQIRGPVISPHGRLLAYASNDNNRFEIYVQGFPEPGARHLISIDGGTEPVWSRDGRELFYRNGDKMMAVSVDTKGSVQSGKPEMVFQGAFAASSNDAWYDVSADGERFLMLQADGASASDGIIMIQDWMDTIKTLAPVKK